MLLIILLLGIVSHISCSITPCGVGCTCYDVEDFVIVTCEKADLTSLPILQQSFAVRMTMAHLQYNNIILLNPSVLATWRSLTFLDLRDNPIDCGQLGVIPTHITYYTDCIISTTLPINMTTIVDTSTEYGSEYNMYVCIYIYIYIYI